jgi:hypothetical protein
VAINGEELISNGNGLHLFDHKSEEEPNHVRKRKVDHKGTEESLLTCDFVHTRFTKLFQGQYKAKSNSRFSFF